MASPSLPSPIAVLIAKAAGELLDYPFDFAGDLAPSDTISGTPVVQNLDAGVTAPLVTVDAARQVATVIFAGGTAGGSYYGEVKAISVGGRTLIKAFNLPVVASR